MSGVAVDGAHAPSCMPNVIIWFKRVVGSSNPDDWLLDRITISTPNFFQDTKLNDRKPASQRFVGDVWAFLSDYLPVNGDGAVTGNQMACLETPNFLLHGIVAVGRKAAEGMQRAFITIKNFLGSLKEIFKNNDFPDLLSDLECNISARALSDVILPALNLVATGVRPSTGSADAKIIAFIKNLEANKHDIEFYAALISRFIASKDSQKSKHPISPSTDTHRSPVDAGLRSLSNAD